MLNFTAPDPSELPKIPGNVSKLLASFFSLLYIILNYYLSWEVVMAKKKKNLGRTFFHVHP